ncbi:MAG: adenylate kinase, partial [Chloroflexota bacterium]
RVVLWRLFRRTMSRGLRRTELWNGNRESLRTHFLTRDSLFLWAKNTHWKHRREWPAVFRQPEMAHVRIVRLRSPREAEAWLRRLGASWAEAAE